MNFTFNNSSIVSVNSGTIVLNVSGKTRTFVDTKLVSAVDGKIVLDLPKLSTIEAGTYLVAHVVLNDAKRIFIAKSIENDYLTYYITQCQGNLKSTGVWTSSICRYATPEEIQEFNNQLEAEGKRWNPDTMQIEKLRRKPMYGDKYYCVNLASSSFVVCHTWTGDTVDYSYYDTNNCFKTKKEAEAKLKRIKEILTQ